jgi:hypothetical protein
VVLSGSRGEIALGDLRDPARVTPHRADIKDAVVRVMTPTTLFCFAVKTTPGRLPGARDAD